MPRTATAGKWDPCPVPRGAAVGGRAEAEPGTFGSQAY